MTLEDTFNHNLQEWKSHIQKKKYSSLLEPYLDCDAFRVLAGLGRPALPLIYKQLHAEYETMLRYDQKLKTIKQKVFGIDTMELLNDAYEQIRKDPEYLEYEREYSKELMASPLRLWGEVVREIVPEFRLPVDKEEIFGVIWEGCKEPEKETLRWLDEYLRQHHVED